MAEDGPVSKLTKETFLFLVHFKYKLKQIFWMSHLTQPATQLLMYIKLIKQIKCIFHKMWFDSQYVLQRYQQVTLSHNLGNLSMFNWSTSRTTDPFQMIGINLDKWRRCHWLKGNAYITLATTVAQSEIFRGPSMKKADFLSILCLCRKLSDSN